MMTQKTVIAPTDLGRGLTLVGDKVEADIGQGLAFNGNKFDVMNKDILVAARNALQAGFQTNVTLLFNTINFVRGTAIALNTTTGVFTLQPGKSYLLEGSIGGVSGGASGFMNYAWRNLSTLAFLDSHGGIYSQNFGTVNNFDAMARAVITPNAVMTVGLVGSGWTGLTNAGFINGGTRLLPTAVIREM